MRKRVDRRFLHGRLEVRPSLEQYEERLLLSGGFSQYPIADSTSMQRFGITAGSDGTIWFVDATGKLGKVASDGTVSLIDVSGLTPDGGMPILNGVTTAPDGSVWFIGGHGIGKVAPDGTITTIIVPGTILNDGSAGFASGTGITTDQAGNVWFIRDNDHVARYEVAAGTFTTFDLPGASNRGTNRGGIVLGPDGNIWLTRLNGLPGHNSSIDRITSDGTVTEFQLSQDYSSLDGLTVGPDGNLWFVGNSSAGGTVGRVTPEGEVAEYAVPGLPGGITSGPDGNLWFTLYTTGQIGRITPSGEVSVFTAPAGDPALSNPQSITLGPDGTLWFTQAGADRIGRLDPATAKPDGSQDSNSSQVSVEVLAARSATHDRLARAAALKAKQVLNARLEMFRVSFLSRHADMVRSMATFSRLAANHPRPAAAKFRLAQQKVASQFAAAYKHELSTWLSHLKASSAAHRKP